MEFLATPTDVMRLADTARRLEHNPLTLAGKLAGLGTDEQRAGVPPWAWVLLALGVGAGAGYVLSRKRDRPKAFG